jgi:hypothetical protein
MEDVDVDKNIVKMVDKRHGRNKLNRLFSWLSPTARYNLEIPEGAPLGFPKLNPLQRCQQEGAVRQFSHFLRNCYDRQGAAKFEAQNAGSRIPQAPHTEFTSNYSDPDHPAGNSGLISVASAGKYNQSVSGMLQERITNHWTQKGIYHPVGIETRKERERIGPYDAL